MLAFKGRYQNTLKHICFLLICMNLVSYSYSSYAGLFHNEDEELHPYKKISFHTKQVNYDNPVRNFFSSITFGIIQKSDEQIVTYKGKKITRWKAKLEYHRNQREEKCEKELGWIKYEGYSEPIYGGYDGYTVEQLRDMNFIVNGIRLESETRNKLEELKEAYRNKMISIYGEEKIKKQENIELKKKLKLEEIKRKNEEEERKKKEMEEKKRKKEEYERIRLLYTVQKGDAPHIVDMKNKVYIGTYKEE